MAVSAVSNKPHCAPDITWPHTKLQRRPARVRSYGLHGPAACRGARCCSPLLPCWSRRPVKGTPGYNHPVFPSPLVPSPPTPHLAGHHRDGPPAPAPPPPPHTHTPTPHPSPPPSTHSGWDSKRALPSHLAGLHKHGVGHTVSLGHDRTKAGACSKRAGRAGPSPSQAARAGQLLARRGLHQRGATDQVLICGCTPTMGDGPCCLGHARAAPLCRGQGQGGRASDVHIDGDNRQDRWSCYGDEPYPGLLTGMPSWRSPARTEEGEALTWEDENVVGLARHVALPINLHRLEGAARGKHTLALAPPARGRGVESGVCRVSRRRSCQKLWGPFSTNYI